MRAVALPLACPAARDFVWRRWFDGVAAVWWAVECRWREAFEKRTAIESVRSALRMGA